MAELQQKRLNVKVSRLGDPQYGTGPKQGVAFESIKGFWGLSPGLREREEVAKNWPPAIGHVLNVLLEVKPNTNRKSKSGVYLNILDVKRTTGEAETWDYEQPERDNEPAHTLADRDVSIARQVALKSTTDVLVALIMTTGKADGLDADYGIAYARWLQQNDGLWNGMNTESPVGNKDETEGPVTWVPDEQIPF